MDLLILACIALYIGYKLYISLGDTKYDNDVSEENRKAFEEFKNSIVKEIEATAEKEKDLVVTSEYEASLSDSVRYFLEDYRKSDPYFTLDKFLKGAANAFEMVINAYANEEIDTLKKLVSKDILEKFKHDINHLHSNGQKRYTALVSIKSIDVIDAYKDSETSYINVHIISEQIIYISDNVSGELISGSTSKIKNCEDKWLFSKQMHNKSNMWELIKVI